MITDLLFKSQIIYNKKDILCARYILFYQHICKRGYKEAAPKVFNKKSSHTSRWIQRQISDRYVLRAKNDNYRSRAAYKLIELDNKYLFLKKNKIILDIGCYPGSWCQVILERTKNYKNKIIGIDKKIMDRSIFFSTNKILSLQYVRLNLSDKSASLLLYMQGDLLIYLIELGLFDFIFIVESFILLGACKHGNELRQLYFL